MPKLTDRKKESQTGAQRIPGTSGIPQRVLQPADPLRLRAEPAQPGYEAAAGGTAREVLCHGVGQPLASAETKTRLLPQAGSPADAASGRPLGQASGLQNCHEF